MGIDSYFDMEVRMNWIPITTSPPVSREDVYSPLSSGPVLVARKSGGICVARYEAWDVWSVDYDEFTWVTDDSEGWTITDDVTHWVPLPQLPELGGVQ